MANQTRTGPYASVIPDTILVKVGRRPQEVLFERNCWLPCQKEITVFSFEREEPPAQFTLPVEITHKSRATLAKLCLLWPADHDYVLNFAGDADGKLTWSTCLRAPVTTAPRLESPLEEAFWLRWQQLTPQIHLVAQYEVFGGQYRLDFAHLPTKTAIELDGFTYHRDAERFQNDRRRDRRLQADGWRVIRFASAELRDNLDQCIQETLRIIRGQ